MIIKVNRIKDFGVFRNFSWQTAIPEFKQFNLIYGWNYSGKTNFQECSDALSCHNEANAQKIHSCNSRKPTLRPKITREYFFSHPRRISKYFFPPFKKIKTPDTQADNAAAYTYRHYNGTTEKEAHAHNKGLPNIAG